jgi:predicted metal-dependent peptidase
MVRRQDFEFTHLCWYLLHEMMHVISGHGSRRGNREAILWNLATDHVIECFLRTIYENEKKAGKKHPIVTYGGIEKANIIDDICKAIPNATAEEAYDWIIKNRSQFAMTSECDGKGGGECPCGGGDGSGDGKPNPNSKWVKVKDKKSGKEFWVHNPQMGMKEKKAEKMAQAEHRAQFEQAKMKGNLPAGIAQYLEKLLKVEVPWTELLEKAIKTSAVVKPSGRSYRNVNPYFRHLGFTLPGNDYEEENEGVGTMIIGVDVSGSISKTEAMSFAGIIMDSIKYFKEIRVFVHDVDVHQDLTYNKDTILEFAEMMKKEGFKGGGGTSHNPVFTKTGELYEDDEDNISMAIFLTDGYSDIEHIWPKHRWSKDNHIPTYFVITKNGKFIEKVPGSEYHQIQINETEDYDL